MAYAALVSVAQTMHLILSYHQDIISPQLQHQVVSIQRRVNGILQAFPQEFPDNLEGRLREAAVAVEDAIEFQLSKHIHDSFAAPQKSKFKDVQIRFQYRFQHRCSGYHDFKHQTWNIYRRLQYDLYNLNKATEEIEFIAEKIMEIQTRIRPGDSTAATSSSTAATSHKDVILGRDVDVMEIKSRLCGESSKLEVIPIVGMGGIGKTTLARNVYDDPLIMECFDIRAWVTLSEDYSVQEIISNFLVSMKVFASKKEAMEAHHVYQHLKSRKYLIVLDDVWSTQAWDDLKMMFPDDGNGSRIMITTRLSDVATYPDSYSPVHEMHLMDDDESWDMLRQKVFRQDACPEELEGVGKMIARSCRGLPLAIAVISGLLMVDQTKAAWESIAKDVMSVISANDEQCDKILSLSYTRLPHHLRACLLYMGGFPEDYKIHAVKLIRLWVAEGFVKPDENDKTFEETAEEYLEDLVKRSLVSVTERKSNGRIKIVGMHDLLRQMCLRRSQQENFILLIRGVLGEGMHIPGRLIIYHNKFNFLENLCGSTIRTLIRDNPTGIIGKPCCLGQFRLLRILDLLDSHGCFYPQMQVKALPAEVYELFHLRYFGMDHVFKLVSAISNLQNLQTLVIREKYPRISSNELPVEIWSLRQLRHLIVCYGDLPPPSFLDEGAPENLQTFYTARNFVLTPQALKVIPNLKKLGLIYVSSEDTNRKDYHLQNLLYLQHLEKLKLVMFKHPHVNLAFPRSLKKLSLSRVRLPWDEMGIVGSLPNLEVLKLRFHYGVSYTWETGDGQFPQLKLLEMAESDLVHWITESSHFPRLKHLVLRGCRDLIEIPADIGEISTLELIEVDGQRLLVSAKQIQEEQQGYGNESIQVRLVKEREAQKWEYERWSR